MTQEIRTGSPQLDSDLRVFFSKLEAGDFVGIEETSRDTNLSAERLLQVAGPEIIRLASAFVSSEEFQDLSRVFSEEALTIVSRARGALDSIPSLPKHPKFKQAATRAAQMLDEGGSTSKVSPLGKEFHVPKTIQHVIMLAGDENPLCVARLGVVDRSDELVTDMTLEIGDVAFLASGFMKIVTNQWEYIRKNKEKYEILLTSDQSRKLRESVEEIKGYLSRIDLAPEKGATDKTG